MRNLALLVLVAACIHEFLWTQLPAGLGLQGNTRNVTQWLLICSLLWVVYSLANTVQNPPPGALRFVAAVCTAIAFMSSTTAGCSAWWLISRFEILPGQEQCSKTWGLPMTLFSCAAALVVFWLWEDRKNERQG